MTLSVRLTNRYKERFKKNLHLYKGKAVGFRADRITIPGNKLAQREFLTHHGAVGVLAFESPQNILLVKQYRYPVKRFTYEIPAGKLSVGEAPLACVRRELEEETGFRARKISKMVTYWPTAAFSTEVIHLYVATGLIPTRAHPDEDEFLELVHVSPRQIERWMRNGRIRDSKTLIAYLAWKALF
jgi:ADP-ribose pyrophosphatase